MLPPGIEGLNKPIALVDQGRGIFGFTCPVTPYKCRFKFLLTHFYDVDDRCLLSFNRYIKPINKSRYHFPGWMCNFSHCIFELNNKIFWLLEEFIYLKPELTVFLLQIYLLGAVLNIFYITCKYIILPVFSRNDHWKKKINFLKVSWKTFSMKEITLCLFRAVGICELSIFTSFLK